MNNRDISLIEHVIRSHADTKDQTASHSGANQTTSRPPSTIAISREVGAMGNKVATEVGRRLDWPVYDRNILDNVYRLENRDEIANHKADGEVTQSSKDVGQVASRSLT